MNANFNSVQQKLGFGAFMYKTPMSPIFIEFATTREGIVTNELRSLQEQDKYVQNINDDFHKGRDRYIIVTGKTLADEEKLVQVVQKCGIQTEPAPETISQIKNAFDELA